MMPYRDILSGSPDTLGSAITSLTQYPTKTTIHTVPPNETHTIWLTFTNSHGVATPEILGDIGDATDVFNFTFASTESVEEYGPITLFGGSSGTTLKMAAVANWTSVKVCGSVERYRSDR